MYFLYYKIWSTKLSLIIHGYLFTTCLINQRSMSYIKRNGFLLLLKNPETEVDSDDLRWSGFLLKLYSDRGQLWDRFLCVTSTSFRQFGQVECWKDRTKIAMRELEALKTDEIVQKAQKAQNIRSLDYEQLWDLVSIDKIYELEII